MAASISCTIWTVACWLEGGNCWVNTPLPGFTLTLRRWPHATLPTGSLFGLSASLRDRKQMPVGERFGRTRPVGGSGLNCPRQYVLMVSRIGLPPAKRSCLEESGLVDVQLETGGMPCGFEEAVQAIAGAKAASCDNGIKW